MYVTRILQMESMFEGAGWLPGFLGPTEMIIYFPKSLEAGWWENLFMSLL